MRGARESTGDETRHSKLDSLDCSTYLLIFFYILTTRLLPVPRWSNAGPLDQWHVIHEIAVLTNYIPKFGFSIPESDTYSPSFLVLNTVVLTLPEIW
jgi:hypothetical protein